MRDSVLVDMTTRSWHIRKLTIVRKKGGKGAERERVWAGQEQQLQGCDLSFSFLSRHKICAVTGKAAEGWGTSVAHKAGNARFILLEETNRFTKRAIYCQTWELQVRGWQKVPAENLSSGSIGSPTEMLIKSPQHNPNNNCELHFILEKEIKSSVKYDRISEQLTYSEDVDYVESWVIILFYCNVSCSFRSVKAENNANLKKKKNISRDTHVQKVP